MGLFNTVRMGASGASGDYEVERSARFNRPDNHHLKKQPSSAGNRRTFTISTWVKRLSFGSNSALFYAGTSVGANHDDTDSFRFDTSDRLTFEGEENQSVKYAITTNRKFRDPSAWYHIVLAVDTTQATSSNRIKFYVNGVQETSLATSTYPSQNYELFVNSTVSGGYTSGNIHVVGYTGGGRGLDGYIAEYHLIDGLQLTPDSFGETKATTGQWIPIDTSGLTYGTNGFRLQFLDNSSTTATTLGKDTSGNSNNYTPQNFGGTAVDQLKDTPTSNFPTLNSAILSPDITFKEGGLYFDAPDTHKTTYSTFGVRSGKWYWEAKAIAGSTSKWTYGVSDVNNVGGKQVSGTNYLLGHTTGDNLTFAHGDAVSIYTDDLYKNGTNTVTDIFGAGVDIAQGDIVSIALDVDAGKVWFARNGTWINGSASASTTLNASSHDTTVTVGEAYTPAFSGESADWQVNFGQDDSFSGTSTSQGNTDSGGLGSFYYAVPSGFKAICNANLPDPSIALPDKYFDTLLYTGNSTNNRAITGLEFQPDFVWIKKRASSIMTHWIVDALRPNTDNSTGNGNVGALASNSTDGEQAHPDGGFESFDANGFTLGKGSNDNNADSAYQRNNANGQTYVAWNWDAGSSTVSNSNGSVTSSVRANTTAGFSVVSWTSTGTTGSTIGHGLGVKPDVIILKARNTSDAQPWRVYHTELGATGSVMLDSSNAFSAQTGVWNDTEPTSSVFTVGSFGSVNENTKNYIAYCFSGVTGYSKFGKYTSNGNVDGAFVFTGFRPAWVMLKQSSNSDTAYWFMFDSKRSPKNVIGDEALAANLTEVEGLTSWNPNTSNSVIDFLSNGFKIRTTSTAGFNVSGETMIYFAFAESPFKYSRAR